MPKGTVRVVLDIEVDSPLTMGEIGPEDDNSFVHNFCYQLPGTEVRKTKITKIKWLAYVVNPAHNLDGSNKNKKVLHPMMRLSKSELPHSGLTN